MTNESDRLLLDAWIRLAMPHIEDLMDAATAARESLASGPEAMKKAANQISDVGKAGKTWLVAHRCPGPLLGDRLAMACDGFSAVALGWRADDAEDFRTLVNEPLSALNGVLGRLRTDLAREIGRETTTK